MRIRTTVVALLVCSFLWNSSAMAQQRHVVDPAAMRQAIADQAVTDQQNRDAVLGLLHHSQVRELADRLGLSVTRAEGAVSTLDSAELARLAGSRARTVPAIGFGGVRTRGHHGRRVLPRWKFPLSGLIAFRRNRLKNIEEYKEDVA